MGKPDIRSQSESTLQVRYEKAIELALDFMNRHRFTQSGLADVLGVNVSSLNRFLNQSAGHTPNPERPGKLQILERIEEKCALVNAFTQLERRSPRADEASTEACFEIWFDNFQERLTVFEQKYAPATALAICPELCAQAMAAPAPWGGAMATNLLLRIFGHVSELREGDATRALLEATLKRVRDLEASAHSKATKAFMRELPHKTPGYAGAAIAWIGIHLDEDTVVNEGIEKLTDAAQMPHNAMSDGHSVNLLRLLEWMLERHHDLGPKWAERLAPIADTCWMTSFRYALETHELPCVNRCFSKLIPHRVANDAKGAGR